MSINTDLMTRVRRLRQFNSPDEIAATLVVLGIQPAAGSYWKLEAIERAINDPLEPPRFFVDGMWIEDDDYGDKYKAPQVVHEFVERLGRHHYPELESEAIDGEAV